MADDGKDGKAVRMIFSPAVALLNRMSYTRKFTLLWLMSLIAIGIVVYSLFVSLERVIQPSRRELQGLVLIEPISRVVQAVQIHRGTSVALLGGAPGMAERLAARERDAAAAFAAMERALPPDLASGDGARRIQAEWARLRAEGLSWSVDENFVAHTRLIERLQSLRSAIADDYALTLDGELATFYLIDTNVHRLPRAIEHLGQMRAYGTGIVSGRRLAERQKIKLNTLVAELDDALAELRVNIDKSGRHNPAVRDSLLEAYEIIAGSARTLTGIVAAEILTERFAIAPVEFLDKATVEIDKAYAQMHGSLLPTTRAAIETRIALAKRTLIVSVAGALLLFLLVVYVSVGIYYAIDGSIQSLVRSAHTFATGDLSARARLDTRDEISHIADSFNTMADGFSALLDERRRAEQALEEGRERYFAIIENALDAVVQMDTDGIITGWNAQAEKTFGWRRHEAIGRALDETIIPSQYRAAHRRGLARFLATGAGSMMNSRVELTALHRDGHEFPVELAIVQVRTASKLEFSAFIDDITARKQSEDLIWKQANFDGLTGLPNRHMFYDRLAQEIRKAERSGLAVALLYIDLDRFKEINDTLGHGMGDVLLVEAARRIVACVRATDTVARLGGDEFVIVLTELGEASRIDALTQSVLQALAEPFQLGGDLGYISASIGITLYPHDATGREDLVKNADQAMYAAKSAGRNRFSYFTQAMQHTAQAKLKLSNDLHRALAAGQFELHYQPIVELATGRIRKAEALIRWRHPARGLVSPVEFIPLAEESGLIVEIGDWVFHQAAAQAARWKAGIDPDFEISVNVSPVQFRGVGNPCQTWPAHLRALDLPGRAMVIEITEGLLLEAEQGVRDKLQRFHQAGIRVSLDDFGTGYSALSYLQRFDIDFLKIDQSFTRDLAPGSNSMALSEAIIVMAHRLGMKVIAEGVETQAQRDLLAGAGCDYGQGYLFSRPVAAEEFEAVLKGA